MDTNQCGGGAAGQAAPQTIAARLAAAAHASIAVDDLLMLHLVPARLAALPRVAFADAVVAVVDALGAGDAPPLYLVQASAPPQPVTAGMRFDHPEVMAGHQRRRMLSRGLSGSAVGPGSSGGTAASPVGAVDWLRLAWPRCTTSDALAWQLGGVLAITRQAAAEVFGLVDDAEAPNEGAAPRTAPTGSALVAVQASRAGLADDARGLRLVRQPGPLLATVETLHAAPAAAATGGKEELRRRIDAHKPMEKRGRFWPDKALMLKTMLQQYDDHREFGSESAIAEERIAELWKMKDATVHTYLTEARKAVEVDPAGTAQKA